MGDRTPVHVWSGEMQFSTTATTIEQQGPWYCPVLGSLMTADGRLLLTMLERLVSDVGGCYLSLKGRS